MTSQKINCWIVSGSVLLVGIGLQSSSAQKPTRNDPYGPRGEVVIDGYRVDPNSPPRYPDGTPVISWAGSKSAIRIAAEELRDAKDDEAKSKAEENLRGLLRNYFGEDMARREKELEAMQNRLKKLQEQLAKRRDKMQEIVDLQIKVLTNEADGLGFFSGDPSPSVLPPALETAVVRPYYFYSPRNAEEGRATIQPAPMPAPTAPIPGATPDPTPDTEAPTPPSERRNVPDIRY